MILRVHYLKDNAESANFPIELLEDCVLWAEAWSMVSGSLVSHFSNTMEVVPECCSQLTVWGSILSVWKERPLRLFGPAVVLWSRHIWYGWCCPFRHQVVPPWPRLVARVLYSRGRCEWGRPCWTHLVGRGLVRARG